MRAYMRLIDRWRSPPDGIERSLSCPALPRLWLPLLAPPVPLLFLLGFSPPARVTPPSLPIPAGRRASTASTLDNTFARGIDDVATELERAISLRLMLARSHPRGLLARLRTRSSAVGSERIQQKF